MSPLGFPPGHALKFLLHFAHSEVPEGQGLLKQYQKTVRAKPTNSFPHDLHRFPWSRLSPKRHKSVKGNAVCSEGPVSELTYTQWWLLATRTQRSSERARESDRTDELPQVQSQGSVFLSAFSLSHGSSLGEVLFSKKVCRIPVF